MDADELSNYRFQLAQVQASLERDPENAQLLKLQEDLGDLIALTEQMVSTNATSFPTTTTPTTATPQAGTTTATDSAHPSQQTANPLLAKGKEFQIGDVVEAKYSGDGRYYEARIQGRNVATDAYSVVFLGYGNTEFVPRESVRPVGEVGAKKRLLTSSAVASSAASAGTSQSSFAASSSHSTAAADPHASKKKRRTKEEQIAKKEAEFKAKQSQWTQFTQKASTKKKSLLNKKSIFAVGEQLGSRVGVSGSGGVMTNFQQKEKYKWKNSTAPPADSPLE